MWVIKKTNGMYVAKPGRKDSYTRDLVNAQIFKTKEAADSSRCVGNEIVVSVDSILSIIK